MFQSLETHNWANWWRWCGSRNGKSRLNYWEFFRFAFCLFKYRGSYSHKIQPKETKPANSNPKFRIVKTEEVFLSLLNELWYTLQRETYHLEPLLGKVCLGVNQPNECGSSFIHKNPNLIVIKAAELSMHDVVGNTEWDRLEGIQRTVSWLRLFRLNFIQFGDLGIMFKDTETNINAAFLILFGLQLENLTLNSSLK